MLMDELRNQLKNQDLDTVNPAAFLEVGGVVFPDKPSAANLADFKTIVEAYRAVHQPSLGSPIALSGNTVAKAGEGNILEPSTSQVALISALQCENLGGSPIVLNITIGGIAVSSQTLAAGSTLAVALTSKYVDKNTPLGVVVVSGSESDLISSCSYLLTSQ
tara:strand:+ start:381 stop:866 length:486 start_codon:yes stop_codon:yes gene_type:complete